MKPVKPRGSAQDPPHACCSSVCCLFRELMRFPVCKIYGPEIVHAHHRPNGSDEVLIFLFPVVS